MTLGILLGGIIMMVCIIANKLSSRIGVPVLLLFILLGILSGSDGLLKIQFDNYIITGQLSSFALIFIMFYGGFGTNWKIARPVASPAICLSTLGVIITAGLTGVFCHYSLKITWLESFLIGAVISSTDAASVFSILRYKKLNLKHGLASMLEIESGSNDPTAYMLTVFILSLMENNGQNVFWLLFSQIALGFLSGVIMAVIGVWILKRIKFENGGLESIFVVAIALVTYALPTILGGNGYLAVYIAGIVLGNSRIHHKTQLVHFFDGITWIMQIMLFFVIGLLSEPSRIPQILLPASMIALFLTFVARPVTVVSILSWFKIPLTQQTLVAWSGLRGAASIVFAILAVISPAYTDSDIFHIVFCVALLSVGFSGTLLPMVARKLKLVDDSEPVFKTFTDYEHLSQLPLLDIVIKENHPWIGKTLGELSLPSDLLIIMIKRNNKSILPKGATRIVKNDVIIMSGTTYESDVETILSEELIYTGHSWLGKTLDELPPKNNILMVRRNDATMVPYGDLKIMENDMIVYSEK